MLISSSDSDHSVHFYKRDGEAVDAVSDYVAAGLDRGEPALVASTSANGAAVVSRLLRRGYKEARERVTLLDSESIAEEMRGGQKAVVSGFKGLVEPAVKAAAVKRKRLRVYGDIVNVLWRRGYENRAIQLEELWSALIRKENLRLLCGYRLDWLDCRCMDIAAVHDAVQPSADFAGLEGRVEAALSRVLGDQVRMVRSLVASDRRLRRLPPGQGALLWVGRHMPTIAEKIAARLSTP